MKIILDYSDKKLTSKTTLLKREQEYLNQLKETSKRSYDDLQKILKKSKKVFSKLEIKITF